MTKEALIVYGGWEGHQPRATTEIAAQYLIRHDFHVLAEESLEVLESDRLHEFDLIIPNWTMGEISADQSGNLLRAVAGGTGMAGWHGGMGDAFRNSPDFQFAVGSQFVQHPGGHVEYEVRIRDHEHPITQGVEDFKVTSEQYYLHVDPSNHTLATTRFPVADGPHAANGPFDMPVAYTRKYDAGNVFYMSLGHAPEVLEMPPVERILTNGMLWAARQLAVNTDASSG